eukprot:10906628-Alexandrium_andersonii.AAC.1
MPWPKPARTQKLFAEMTPASSCGCSSWRGTATAWTRLRSSTLTRYAKSRCAAREGGRAPNP